MTDFAFHGSAGAELVAPNRQRDRQIEESIVELTPAFQSSSNALKPRQGAVLEDMALAARAAVQDSPWSVASDLSG